MRWVRKFQRGSICLQIRRDLEDMGFDKDEPINGGDAVDYLTELFKRVGGKQS